MTVIRPLRQKLHKSPKCCRVASVPVHQSLDHPHCQHVQALWEPIPYGSLCNNFRKECVRFQCWSFMATLYKKWMKSLSAYGIFSTTAVHWQYPVLLFDLHGAPATFQQLMDLTPPSLCCSVTWTMPSSILAGSPPSPLGSICRTLTFHSVS